MNTLTMPARLTSNASEVETDRLVIAQETERARIARELHDSLGQKIAVLQMDLDQIARGLPSHEQAQLHRLSIQIADIARELHDVSYELHPLKLEILGVEKAIEALCRESSRQSGIVIDFSANADLPAQIGSSESLCLFRVAQEALHNIVKHSKASRASVQLIGQRDALDLEIADEGDGFDDTVATQGLGLASMRQRVQLLNGTVAVHTRRSAGTRISVRIPLRRQAMIDRTKAS